MRRRNESRGPRRHNQEDEHGHDPGDIPLPDHSPPPPPPTPDQPFWSAIRRSAPNALSFGRVKRFISNTFRKGPRPDEASKVGEARSSDVVEKPPKG
jgi:hypothetical protein